MRIIEQDSSKPLTDAAKARLNDIIKSLKALIVLTERRLESSNKPVFYGDKEVKGYAILANVGDRTVMQGMSLRQKDIQQYAVAVLTMLYDEMEEDDFYGFMMELGKVVKLAANDSNREKELTYGSID